MCGQPIARLFGHSGNEGCEVWEVMAHGIDIAQTYWTGYIHDVTRDINYDISTGVSGVATRGLNFIRISRNWDSCVVEGPVNFDTNQQYASQDVITWLADTQIGDVIICASSDDMATGLTNAAISELLTYDIDLSSTILRYNNLISYTL